MTFDCATAGCENAREHRSRFCARCTTQRAAAQSTADAADATSLFSTRASLPDTLADEPVAGTAATSRAAAKAVRANYRTRKQLIHEHILQEGPRGATRPEIARALGIKVSSVNSACNTLYRQGLIASNPDETRPDPESGLACAVLVDETFVTRWKGKPRRERSRVYATDDAAGIALGECDLVHPDTGAPLSETEQRALMGVVT
jgi:predicted transcriptional regulator